MSEWQPIETVLKDGTPVDLYGSRNGEPQRFADAKWAERSFGGQLLGVWQWYHAGWDIYGEFVYTHWRYQPAPPICAHEWVDVRNEVVVSGEYCPKCHAIQASPTCDTHTEE